MPEYEVELSDGKVFELESDHRPSNEELLSAVSEFEKSQTQSPDIASQFLFEPDSPWQRNFATDQSIPEGSSPARRVIADPALNLAQGVVGLPEAAVGLADIPTLGFAGKAVAGETEMPWSLASATERLINSSFGTDINLTPKFAQTKAFIEEGTSPESKLAMKRFSEAEGVIPKLQAAIQNPSVITGTVAESIPSTLGGAAAGRVALSALGKAAPYVGAAIGEGAVSAGQMAEDVRSQTESGYLTPKQAGLSAVSGALTGFLGAVGGRLAQKLGLADIDTLLTKGVTREAAEQVAKKNMPLVKEAIGSMVSEGFLEELPQSLQEQIAQNLALGKQWSEGLEDAGILGALSGVAMGGGAPVIQRGISQPTPERTQNVSQGSPIEEVQGVSGPIQSPEAVLGATEGVSDVVAENRRPTTTEAISWLKQNRTEKEIESQLNAYIKRFEGDRQISEQKRGTYFALFAKSEMEKANKQKGQNAIQSESVPIPGNVQQPEVTQEGTQQVPASQDRPQVTQTLTPAVRSETGVIETAPDHGTAQLQLARKGEIAVQTDRPRDFGFVDETGKFITREEAVPIFEKIYGKKPADPNRLTSEDLKAQAVSEPVHTLESDKALYKDLTTQMVAKMRSGDISSPEFKELTRQIEVVKNRHGGMPPGQTSPARVPTAPAPPAPVAEQAPAVAHFPRQSEMAGMGEPSMPPTAQDVRAQRGQEAKNEPQPPKILSRARELLKTKNKTSVDSRVQALADEFHDKLLKTQPKTEEDIDSSDYLNYMASKYPDPRAHVNMLRAITNPTSSSWDVTGFARRLLGREQVDYYAKAGKDLFDTQQKELDRNQEEFQAALKEPAASEPRRAVGFFPRQSEMLGLGESALPPTVETVRQQRAQEARESGIAPGAKTTESRGTFFAGKNPRETASMMQARAKTFLTGRTDEEAIVDLARMAGGDPNVQLDNQAANFVIKDLLVKIHRQIQTTKNPVYQQQAWQQIDRLAELSRRMGAEDARSLVSRNLAYKQIDWLMPLLAWRGIVKERWRKALGLQEGQPLDESVITKEEAKKRGLPELNGEQTEKLAKLSKEAEGLPQGIRRNKVMDEMVKVMQEGAPISKTDLLRDIWYGSVLMRVGTMLNVLAGSYGAGASFAGLAALDRLGRGHPIQAMKIIGQFLSGTMEGTLIADQVARKGAYHLLPDAEQRMVNLLTGKAGARYDNLEELLRRGNPVGILAYTRRFMAALDYIGALGTRDSQVLYGALSRNDQDSLDALEKRYNKSESKRAEAQAKSEMGPKATRAEIAVRKREILEEGVSEDLKESAVQTARRAAQNADPRGIPGILYSMSAKLPFWVRAPAGLAFMRSAMNMVQNAVDYMPGIGAVSAARGKMATLPESHPLHRFGLDIPLEERRMMWAAQGASAGIAMIAAAMFLGDDDEDDDGMEISGSWRGLSPQRRSQLMELGERPNSIRFGKKGPWISFKQMPWAPPLAIIGTMRDEERFHAKDWEGESAASKIISAWLSGLLYVRDISSLSGVAGLFDGNAWNTQESPTKLNDRVNKFAAQSIGRAGAGYIPSVLKELDEFADPTLYRPSKDEMAGWWIRNIPYARRTVGPGPALNNFGEPIQTTPPPIKSWAGFGKDNELYETLGKLATRGIFLPEPGRTATIVDEAGERREMTEDEWYRFIKIRGPILKAEVMDNLEDLKSEADEDVILLLRTISEAASAEARGEISQ